MELCQNKICQHHQCNSSSNGNYNNNTVNKIIILIRLFEPEEHFSKRRGSSLNHLNKGALQSLLVNSQNLCLLSV